MQTSGLHMAVELFLFGFFCASCSRVLAFVLNDVTDDDCNQLGNVRWVTMIAPPPPSHTHTRALLELFSQRFFFSELAKNIKTDFNDNGSHRRNLEG